MRPFVLLTVDSLRADCVTSDLLGNSLEVLNRDYASFSNAFSYGVATPFAFPGIIAGHHPVGNGLIPEEASTLAEAISGPSEGYSNNGHLREERGYSRGFDRFEDSSPISEERAESFTGRIVKILKKIDVLRNSTVANRFYKRFIRTPLPQPAFPAEELSTFVRHRLKEDPSGLHWSHWMDPHTPYHPETAIDAPDDLPSLRELEELNDRLIPGDASALSEDEITLSRDLYNANVRYFDKHFARLLEWMAEQPWYDEALIVVVSDHGEYFGEHNYLFHTWDIDPHDEAVNVPLWVKYPNQADGGKTFDHLVGHGDILATAASELDDIDLVPPTHTAPLRSKSNRHVVSVSNTAKRLTEPDGVYIKRRSGTNEREGRLSKDGKDFLDQVPFPECITSKGDAKGVEEAERQRQLRELGYR